MNPQVLDGGLHGGLVCNKDGNDVHDAIDVLHQTFRDKLCSSGNGSELLIYERYVQDLNDLLRKCILYFERDWNQMTTVYEKRITDLSEELEHSRQSSQQAVLDQMNNLTIEKTDERSRIELEDLQATIVKLNNEINQLRRENDSLKNHELRLQAENGSLKTEVAMLKADVNKLEVERRKVFDRTLAQGEIGMSGDGKNFKDRLNGESEQADASLSNLKSKIENRSTAYEKQYREIVKTISHYTKYLQKYVDDFIKSQKRCDHTPTKITIQTNATSNHTKRRKNRHREDIKSLNDSKIDKTKISQELDILFSKMEDLAAISDIDEH